MTITAKNAEKTYGNPDPAFEAAKISEYVGDELDGINLSVTRSDAGNDEVGVHKGVLSIAQTKADLEAAYTNYTFTIEPADFTITMNEADLTVSAANVEVTYDGNAYGVNAEASIEGATILYKDANGEYTLTESPTWTNVTEAQTVDFKASLNGYKDAFGSATVTIAPRAITLTSESASKVYDGTALTNDTVNVTDGIFAENEGVESYNVTGTQTMVGESENEFTYQLKANTNPDNYVITSLFGILAVTDGSSEEPVVPDGVVTKTHEAGIYKLGDVVTFEIKVTNIYDEVKTITIREQEGVTFTGDSVFEDVAPGAQVTTTATYTITEEDVLRGSFTNKVTAAFSGGNTFEDEDTVDTEEQNGHLTITKTTTSTPANGESYVLGETITYQITATNDGNLTLTDVVVTDELTGDAWTIESMAPNASETFTAEYQVTEGDVLAGRVVNVATAKGTSPDPDNPEVPVEPAEKEDPVEEKNGHLTITKTTTSTPANGESYVLGETITYQITATNDGNLALTDVVVTDELTGDAWTIESMAPNASETFTAEYQVTEGDVLAGRVVNVATAKGTSPDPDNPEVPVEPAEKEDPVEEKNGHLTITKTTTSTPANGESYVLGETITYQITATNDGNLALTNVVVTDELTGDAWTIESMAPGAVSDVFTAAHVVNEADILAGSVINVATAQGTSPDPDQPDVPVVPGTTTDPVAERNPHVTVTKNVISTPANGEAYVLGETIQYNITVTNDGNLTAVDVGVTDILSGNEDNIIARIPTLAPGESSDVPFAYEVTEQDVLAGMVRNLASVVGQNPDPEGELSIPVTPGEVETPVANEVRLTINYWYDRVGGAVAARTFTGVYTYGHAYSVVSPRIAGYTADMATVAGNLLEDATIDVIYTQNTYTVTVQYRYVGNDGAEAIPDNVQTGMHHGDEYRIESPDIEGWTANQLEVSGVIDDGNVVITVFYRRAGGRNFVEIDEYGVPLGLGGVIINVGDCIE